MRVSVAPVAVAANVPVAPGGRPESERATDPAYPLVGVTVTGKVLLWACCTEMEAGAERLNDARVVNVAFWEVAVAPPALVAETAKL